MVGSSLEIAVIMGNGQQYAVDRGEQLGSWRVLRVTDVDVTFQKDATTLSTLKLPMLRGSGRISPTVVALPASHFPHPRHGNGALLNVKRRGGTYQVARSDLDKLLADPGGGITTGMRMDVAVKNGQSYGVVFNYLDASNPFYYFGLRQRRRDLASPTTRTYARRMMAFGST